MIDIREDLCMTNREIGNNIWDRALGKHFAKCREFHSKYSSSKYASDYDRKLCRDGTRFQQPFSDWIDTGQGLIFSL